MITPIINGAKSWYTFGPISIQPSEFMKIILILALIKILGTNETPIILKNNNKSLWNDLLNVN
jgi:rod shape determining protein RodA